MASFTEGSVPGQIKQILWQGLDGSYIAVTSSGLIHSMDGGLTWGSLRPNADLGSADWPEGAEGHQLGWSLNARGCDPPPIWEEVRCYPPPDLEEENPNYWMGLTFEFPSLPDSSFWGDLDFIKIGEFPIEYWDPTLYPTLPSVGSFLGGISLYMVKITGPDITSPYVHVDAWCKASVDLSLRDDPLAIIKYTRVDQIAQTEIPPTDVTVGANFPPGSARMALELKMDSASYVCMTIFQAGSAYKVADPSPPNPSEFMFDPAEGSSSVTVFNGVSYIESFLDPGPTPPTCAAGRGYAIGPFIDPVSVEAQYETYWDEGGGAEAHYHGEIGAVILKL